MAEESNEERRVNLDLLDKAREEARIKADAVKRRVEHQYSSKVKARQFQVADLVMQKAHPYELCTAQVVGSDDVATSDNIGVLNGTPG